MNLGGWNYWFTRIMAMGNRFLQPLNFMMLVYLTAQDQPLAWLMFPGAVIFVVFWFWLDNRNILEKELDYQYNRIPMLRGMRDDLAEIKSMLKERG